jgi:predicted nucleotidyltransferase
MRMSAGLDRRADDIAAPCGRYGVARPKVFGTAARGKDLEPARSGVDFAEEVSDAPSAQVFGLARELAAVPGRPVDHVA